jgi:protein-S-isoprenylcysteine O-methyltransferase Ste14
VPAAPFASARVPLWIAVLICASGIGWRVWGSSYLGRATVFDSAVVTSAFYVSGPFRYTRNPLYFGNVLYATGIALTGPPLTVAFVLVALVALQEALIVQEETGLRARFGATFEAYVRSVPRLIPALGPCVPADPSKPSLADGLRTEVPIIAVAVIAFALGSAHR